MPLTLGFRFRWQFEEHFDAHGADFQARDEAHYEALADAFLGGVKGQTVIEYTRTQFDQALVRYDYLTQAFGILSADNYIQTYYKPDPGEHGRATNRAYFEWQKVRRASPSMSTCPVCGYKSKRTIEDSYICPCCGTQFGYHDSVFSHSDLRHKWEAKGFPWHSRRVAPPADWSALRQLEQAGFLAAR